MNQPTFISQLRSRVSILSVALLSVGASLTAASASAEAATAYWAKVSATGAGLAGSGVTKVIHFGHGRYDLLTSHNISSCALTGTVNTLGGIDPGPGSASILVGAVSAGEIFVRTATPSGSGAATVDDDRPFSVIILCP